MISNKPKTEDQRDEWAQLAATEMASRADQFCRELEVSSVGWRDADIRSRIWGLVGAAYRAGRLFPQELAGELAYFSESPGQQVQSSG